MAGYDREQRYEELKKWESNQVEFFENVKDTVMEGPRKSSKRKGSA
jgi:hypothetical protein